MKMNLQQVVSMMSCAVLLGGCAQQQQGKYTPAPATTEAAAPAKAEPVKSGAAIAYFPSGRAEGSGLSIEKTAPAEVLAGQPFEYAYKVSNLTDATLENVTVSDRVSANFTCADSTPKAAGAKDGNATWNLGTFGPKETKTITVKGSSPNEGVVNTCGWATYNPIVCQDIRVVKANITLTKTEPADVLICDMIPVTLTVKNNGSSALSGVKITDNLPAGMTSEGKSSLSYDVGALAPGESREVKYNAAVSTTGKLVNKAKVTSAQGVSAEVSATTTVHQPVLAITCKATEQQFMGRKFDVSYTVANTGDAAAAGTKLEVAVPAGLNVVSATGNGQISPGKVVWDLGSVEANSPKTVSASFTSATGGTFQFAGTAKGACTTAVTTSCGTKVVGQAAILLEKADDPDPVAIGETTTYTVKVTNQGSADDNNVQVIVTIAPELTPVSSSAGEISGQTVTLPVVPTLASKQAVTYKIVAKGVKAGDGHTMFKLTSEVLKSAITAEESTHVY
jgi:uncharacterized repeat protein (TIGR01451 family)